MSFLLRHPATVPALFSRAEAGDDRFGSTGGRRVDRPRRFRRRGAPAPGAPRGSLVMPSLAVLLAELPMAAAAALALGPAVPR